MTDAALQHETLERATGTGCNNRYTVLLDLPVPGRGPDHGINGRAPAAWPKPMRFTTLP